MAISGAYYRPPQRTDWQSSMERARGPIYGDADPRMVVQPYADPGNALPNIEQRLLVQPEQNAMEVPDIWRVGGPNALGPQLMQQTYAEPMARNALLAGPFDDLADYPKSTARVPQYSMRDTPYYQLIPPITGNETTAPVMSNEAARDADVQRQLAEISQQMAEMTRRPGFTMSMLKPLLDRRAALANSSPTMLQARRETEARKAVPDDVAAIMRGIENAGRR